jgi:hypothetical protein
VPRSGSVAPGLVGVLAVSFGVFAAVGYAWVQPRLESARFEAQRMELAAHGVETSGRLYRVLRDVWEDQGGYSEGIDQRREYWIRFRPGEHGAPLDARLDSSVHDATRIESAITEIERKSAATIVSRNDVPVPYDPRSLGIGVRVIYLRDTPEHFHAPEYYSGRNGSGRSVFIVIAGMIVQFLIAAVFAFVVAECLLSSEDRAGVDRRSGEG